MSPARSSDGIGTVLKARHEGVDALVKIRENGAGSAITIQLAPASDPVSITAPAGTVRTARGSYASGSTSKAPPAPVAWPGWLRSDPSLGQFPPPVTDGNRSRCLIVKFPRSISFVEEVRELLDYYSNLFQKNGFRPNIRMEKESSMLGSKHFFHASVTGTDGVREISVLYGRYNTRHSFDVTINVCPVF